MKRRADGRFQKRVTMPDGTYKMLYSRASSERLANKDFTDQLLRLKEKERNSSSFPPLPMSGTPNTGNGYPISTIAKTPPLLMTE